MLSGLAVGLDPEGYGNPDFCWLSIYDTLIWSFAGPVAFAVSVGDQANCILRIPSLYEGLDCRGRDTSLGGVGAVHILGSCSCPSLPLPR